MPTLLTAKKYFLLDSSIWNDLIAQKQQKLKQKLTI